MLRFLNSNRIVELQWHPANFHKVSIIHCTILPRGTSDTKEHELFPNLYWTYSSEKVPLCLQEITHCEWKCTVHFHAAAMYHQLSSTTWLSKAYPCREVIDSIALLRKVMLVRVGICSIGLCEKYSFVSGQEFR